MFPVEVAVLYESEPSATIKPPDLRHPTRTISSNGIDYTMVDPRDLDLQREGAAITAERITKSNAGTEVRIVKYDDGKAALCSFGDLVTRKSFARSLSRPPFQDSTHLHVGQTGLSTVKLWPLGPCLSCFNDKKKCTYEVRNWTSHCDRCTSTRKSGGTNHKCESHWGLVARPIKGENETLHYLQVVRRVT